MKKKIALIITALMLCFAQSAGAVTVVMNSSLVAFPDQEPVVENGSTLVPVRPIAEALGLEVSWRESDGRVTLKKDDFFIELRIGEAKANTSDGEKLLAAPPKIIGGRTMVPLRFIAETLGLYVSWNGEYQRVIINGSIDTSAARQTARDAGEAEESAEKGEETAFAETEEEAAAEGATIQIATASSSVYIPLPENFVYDDTDDENSFAYRAVDATDVQHLYKWDIVTSYESYADIEKNSGILVIVQEFEPYAGGEVDVSRINEEFPEKPESTVSYHEIQGAIAKAMLEGMCAERGAAVPDLDGAEDEGMYAELLINDNEYMAELLGFESGDEYGEYAAAFGESFDLESVEGYADFAEYMSAYGEYSAARMELVRLKDNAFRNYAELSDEGSDEEWAKFFSSQLNTDPEVRYEGIEILTTDDKKIVHGTIYAEDPDDEQGTFDFYLWFDGDMRATIYGGTLYSPEPSPDAVDALARMTIQ